MPNTVKSLWTISASVAALAAFSTPAAAQSAVQNFDISAQDMNDALRLYGQQSGQQLIFDNDEVRGQRSTALRGAYDADQALHVLLQDSGLGFSRSRAGVLMVQDTDAVPTRTPPAAPAEHERGNALTDEVVVTAQRREDNVQDVSLAVSAFSGEQIAALNIQDGTRVVDLVPNFKAGGLGGANGAPYLSIRGISFVDLSNLNEGSVGVYLDEVYQVAQGAGVAQIYDSERVEVLRGPQGTLFGRNTTAGVVHYISRKPTDEFDANASIQYGQNNQWVLTGAVGGPLSDTFRARGAFKLNQDDGFQENMSIGGRDGATDAIAGRVIAQLDLTPDWMLEGNIHYARNEGTSTSPLPMWFYGPNSGTPGVPSGYCGGLLPPNPAIGGPQPDGSAGDVAWAQCMRSNQGYGRNGQRISGVSADRSYADEHLPFEYESIGGYLKLIGDMEWGTITSITAYDSYDQLFATNADGWNNRPVTNPLSDQRDVTSWFDSSARQFSQELRINGEYNGVEWIGGLYYYRASQEAYYGTEFDTYGSEHGQAYDPNTNNALGCAPGVTAPPGTAACSTASLNAKVRGEVETESYALFGQIDAPISPTLTASFGLRYTDDVRELVDLTLYPACTTPATCGPTTTDEVAAQATTGRAALEWRPEEDVLYYVQYAHGFKSGGFNATRTTAQRGPVDEELVDSWEIGMRRYFLDNRLRFNATAFYYEFTGLQAIVGSVSASGASQTFYINAGDPVGYGLELETAWAITDRLEALLNIGLLSTEIDAPADRTADGRALDGNELVQAPEFSLSGAVRYTVPLAELGDLTFQLDGRWQTDSYVGIDNDPGELIEEYGVLNARAQWRSRDERYTLEAFVDNVLDETYFQHYVALTGSTFSTATPTVSTPSLDGGNRIAGRPRLWGVRFSYDF
jgi:iron complex outermembrane receptor protein